MKYPKLEILARELETVQEGKDKDLHDVIEEARDDNFPRQALIANLELHELKFFADKVRSGYYDKLPDPIE